MASSLNNSDIFSPRRSEGITPRKLQSTTMTTTTLGVNSFLKDLDKIQEQQVHYAKKLDKNKRQKHELDEKLESLIHDVLSLKAQTRSGDAMKEEEAGYKKTIARLEKNLQMARIKLSVVHSENMDCRHQIDAMRRDKVLYLQIQNDLENEYNELKNKIQEVQKEINNVNDAKLRAKQDKTNIKNQMIVDMEEFTRELQAAKQNISLTQEVIIGTIRDRMESSFAAWEQSLIMKQSKLNQTNGSDTKNEFKDNNKQKHSSPSSHQNNHSPNFQHQYSNTSSLKKYDSQSTFDSKLSYQDNDIAYLLAATGASSMEGLMTELNNSEEYIFSLYKNIQNSSLELEKLELENKQLENQVDEKTRSLVEVENHNHKVREDLEHHITQIQKSITVYENGYNTNMQILGTISECLMSILRNVASDEDAMDQQLISSGLNDRNIETYLGIVEQRLDYLIQMSKAAMKDTFTGSDFLVTSKDPVIKKRLTFITPTLPSLDGQQDEIEDDYDENTRVAPISITLLKDFMQKRVQKGLTKAEKQRNES